MSQSKNEIKKYLSMKLKIKNISQHQNRVNFGE